MRKKIHALWHEIKRLRSKESRQSLKWHVLNYVQQRYKTDAEIEQFCRDIFLLGCFFRSVLMDRLDVCRVFDKYYKDIITLLQPWNFTSTEPPKKHEIKNDNWKQDFAQAAFEETVRWIIRELDIKI